MPRLATPTAAEFLVLYGAQEIADRAANEGTAVPGALLQATVEGADRSAWTSAEQAAADAALVRVNTVLKAGASGLRSALPNDDLLWWDLTAASVSAMAIARALLYDDAVPQDIAAARDAAYAWARERRRRVMSVGAVRV